MSGKLVKPGNFNASVNLLGSRIRKVGLVSRVVEIRFEDQIELAGMFRIRLLDPHFELIDQPPFAVGAELVIGMGYRNSLVEVMTGLVEVVQPSFPETGVPSLTVIGYDRSHPLRHVARFRQFQGLNDSGIVQ